MEYFTIGTIANTRGINGHIKVYPATDDITRFELLDEIEVFFESRKGQSSNTFTIQSVSYQKAMVVLKLKEINTMTEAERLKGGVIKIPREKALPLNEDEYYVNDLYGMAVFNESGEKIGDISDVIFTGANDVYAIKTESGKELLIPAIKQCILNVNVSERTMVVKVPEGLD